jgi:transposase
MFMEQKPTKKRHRKYDADFKREVLKMVELGRSVPDISQSLGIGSNLIYTWVKRSKASSADTKFTASVITLDEEKLILHRQIKELEMERDILKKALGIFSRPM